MTAALLELQRELVGGQRELLGGQRELLDKQRKLQDAIAENVSRTRAASKIKRPELQEVLAAVGTTVFWAEEDPPLEELIGHSEQVEEFW
jgi:hypothetical protein